MPSKLKPHPEATMRLKARAELAVLWAESLSSRRALRVWDS